MGDAQVQVIDDEMPEVIADAHAFVAPPEKRLRDPAKLKTYRDKYIAARKACRDAAEKAKPLSKKAKRVRPKATEDEVPGKRGPKGWAPEYRLREGSKKYGARLRKKRLELGYTQEQFAVFFGIKQPHMCNLEKGTFAPGPKLKALIEKKFFAKVGLGKPRKGAPKT